MMASAYHTTHVLYETVQNKGVNLVVEQLATETSESFWITDVIVLANNANESNAEW